MDFEHNPNQRFTWIYPDNAHDLKTMQLQYQKS
jgi:hypothetical protein